jgi:hypothetical protein
MRIRDQTGDPAAMCDKVKHRYSLKTTQISVSSPMNGRLNQVEPIALPSFQRPLELGGHPQECSKLDAGWRGGPRILFTDVWNINPTHRFDDVRAWGLQVCGHARVLGARRRSKMRFASASRCLGR